MSGPRRRKLARALCALLLGACGTTQSAPTVAPATKEPSFAPAGLHDATRFASSLRFDGALNGEFADARFNGPFLSLVTSCGPAERGTFVLDRVRGRVSGEDVDLWFTIRDYHGPDSYRAASGVMTGAPGPASLTIEPQSGVNQWATKSGTIIIDADERSGSLDVIEVIPPTTLVPVPPEVHITGTWRCVAGVARTPGPFPAATDRLPTRVPTASSLASTSPVSVPTLAPGEVDGILAAMERATSAQDWAALYALMNVEVQSAVDAASFAKTMSSGRDRIVRMTRLGDARLVPGPLITAVAPYSVTIRDTVTGTERDSRFDVVLIQEPVVGWRLLTTAERP